MTINYKQDRKGMAKPPVPLVRITQYNPKDRRISQPHSPPLQPTRNTSSTTSTWSLSSVATTYSGRTGSIFDSSSPRSLSPSASSVASTPRITPLPSPKLAVRLGHNVPHCFVSRRFIAPQKCGYCHETLWAKRGVECAHCNFICHAQCAQFVLEKCGLSSELESYGSVLSMFTESDAKSAFNTPLPPSLQRKEYKRYTSTSASSFQIFSLRQSMSSPVASTKTKTKQRTSVIDFSFLDRSRTSIDVDSVRDIHPSVPTSPTTTIASTENPPATNKSLVGINGHLTLPPAPTLTSRRRSSVAGLPSNYPTKDIFWSPYTQSSFSLFNPNSLDESVLPSPMDFVPCANPVRRHLSLLSAPEIRRKQDLNMFSPTSESDIEIDFKELLIGEKIGSGSFGEVHQGYWHGDCAIKLLKLRDPTEAQIASWRNEVEMMRNTRHERILLFMGVCTVPPNLALVTTLCDKGSLYKHIHVLETSFTLPLVVNIATQIAEGLDYLHARGLLHNDLKSHNILLNHQFDVKIGDFGLSSLKRDNRLTKSVQGSVHWLAPEIVRMKDGENPYTEKSDVWSYGMILYELLTSRLPYEGLIGEQILWKIGNGHHPSLDHLRDDTPVEMRRLVLSCWEQDPGRRRSFSEILMDMSTTRMRVGLSLRKTRSLQGLRDIPCGMLGAGAAAGVAVTVGEGVGDQGQRMFW